MSPDDILFFKVGLLVILGLVGFIAGRFIREPFS
jgi:hypothetical protein